MISHDDARRLRELATDIHAAFPTLSAKKCINAIRRSLAGEPPFQRALWKTMRELLVSRITTTDDPAA